MVTFESATMNIIQKEYTTLSDLNVCTKKKFRNIRRYQE